MSDQDVNNKRKEYMKEYMKEYYNKKKEDILKKKAEGGKQRCICEICGSFYDKWGKSQHERTRKHKIKKLEAENIEIKKILKSKLLDLKNI